MQIVAVVLKAIIVRSKVLTAASEDKELRTPSILVVPDQPEGAIDGGR